VRRDDVSDRTYDLVLYLAGVFTGLGLALIAWSVYGILTR
jgi:hypothetical protein